MAPTMPPRTTRGMRTCQMMLHCVSVTPLSMLIPGMWSSRASGTRHQVGPAGPSTTPAKKATRRTATEMSDQRSPPPWRAGTAAASTDAAAVGEVTTSAGGDDGLLESIVDVTRVLDDA